MLYWHYYIAPCCACGTAGVVYAHWWRCMHVVIFTIRVHTILMRMYVCQILCHCHCDHDVHVSLIHCMCWRSYNGNTNSVTIVYISNTLLTILCGMPGMALYSEMSCWSCIFNCIVCLLLYIIHLFISGIYIWYMSMVIIWLRMYVKCIALTFGWLWFVLQELEKQSNFGDFLECVDRVERTSNSVSFVLCGSALSYRYYILRAPCCGSCHYAWSWCACIIAVCMCWRD